MDQKRFLRAITNLQPKLVRNEQLAGRNYTVVPMVMLTEGVHAGSEGPYLYQAQEVAKRVSLWNHKPVVVNHPDEPSACTPQILNVRQIGIILNTEWDTEAKRLKAEAWLDVERLRTVDKGKLIQEAIANEQMMELSTGLFADSDEEPGEWNGEAYNGVLKNLGPDHLAILPDAVGACSIKDGAGFIRNEDGEKEWTTAVLLIDDGVEHVMHNVVVEKGGQWYVYSEDRSKKLGGPYDSKAEALKRLREIEYFKTHKSQASTHKKEKQSMDKEKLVAALIAKNVWAESDREMLMGLDEKVLAKMVPAEVAKAPQNADIPAEPKPVAQVAQPMSEQEYLNSLPATMRVRWQELERQEKAEKDRLITVITANARNTFKPEYLRVQDLEMLQNLARLAQEEKAQDNPRFNYGMGEPVQNVGKDDDVKDIPLLGVPVANVGGKGK